MTMPVAPTWEILGNAITQSTKLSPGGAGIEDYYSVPYRITSGPARGHNGTVEITASMFGPEAVRAAVEAAVQGVHDVASLSG